MSFQPIDIERKLQRIQQNAGLEGALSKANTAIQQNIVSTTSKLGRALETVAGFQALAQSADDVVESITNSRPEQLIGAFAVTQLTKNVPGLKGKLVLEVGDDRTDLNALTGKTVQDGFNQVQITSSDPEAILYHTKKTTNATDGQLRTVLGQAQNLQAKQFELFETSINDLITPIIGAVSGVFASFNKFRAGLLGEFSKVVIGINNELNKGFGSIIENVSEALTGNGRSIVGSLTTLGGVRITLPESDMSFVLSLVSEGTETKINQAVDFLTKYSDLPPGQLRDALRGIDNRASSNIVTPTGNIPTITNNIDTGAKTWDFANTPKSHNFSYVSSMEELEVDLKSITREITEVIVHWTEHFNNQDIDAGDIQDIMSRNGDSIPYHYIIRKDGSLQRGRPTVYEGGSLNNNHEDYSIQIAFVGGINAPTGTTNPKRFLSADSLTSKQIQTFQQFCIASYAARPGIQIMGHNDIDRTQRDPGFDVIIEMENLFGKKNVYDNPSEQPPYTRAELIKVKV